MTYTGKPMLDLSVVDERLQDDDQWSRRDDRIVASFRFGDFAAAFAFMTEVAIVAEKMNHHPEWSNVYNRVDVELTTHDAGGITDYDFDLAARVSEAALRRSS